MPPRGRRAARRTARRTTHRTMRRTHRRRRRRRIVIGGAVLLAAGGTYAAVKLSKKDADRIEQSSGVPPEEMTEEELAQAMRDLGIQSMELTDEDRVAIQRDSAQTDTMKEDEGQLASTPPSGSAKSGTSEDYLEELEKLADLRDRGIITEEEFQAKKKDLLGI